MSDQYQQAFEHRKQAALALVEAHHAGNAAGGEPAAGRIPRGAEGARRGARRRRQTGGETGGEKGFSDTNYIFLSFVTRYLPAGMVGLVIAVIFAATMSASSGEINSLATVTVIDIYQRHFKRDGSDHHYLSASRWLTLFWGVYAVVLAGCGEAAGSLIVAVNMVGSLFYGSLLGCFVLAFLFPTGARHGGILRHAGGRGGDLRDGSSSPISRASGTT